MHVLAVSWKKDNTCNVENYIKHSPVCDITSGGMKYHLLAQEEKLDLQSIVGVMPRVKKYHYQVAVFAGSDQGSCQYFDPKGLYLQLFHH